MSARSFSLFALAALLAAGVLWFWLGGGPQGTGEEGGEPARPPAAAAPAQAQGAAPRAEAIERAEPTVEREVVRVSPREHAARPRGVRGQVTSALGQPLPGIKVYLVDDGPQALTQMALLLQKGQSLPPASQGETDEQGRFVLGLDREPARGQTYRFHAVSPNHVDATRPGIQLKATEWYDMGVIQLEDGVPVRGRVTVEGTGAPIEGAVVAIDAAGSTAIPHLVPGREHGRTAATDRNGFYEIKGNAVVRSTVSASAHGFATAVHEAVQLATGTENRVDFALPIALKLAGKVVDEADRPVAAATVSAIAVKTQLNRASATATSTEDGQFTLEGLSDEHYHLAAAAPGMLQEEPMYGRGGESGIVVRVTRLGSFRLRALLPNGRPLHVYDLSVLSYDAGRDRVGRSKVPDRKVQNPLSDVVDVGGVPPGDYVVAVQAERTARTFSPPFSVARVGEPQLIEVVVNEGGAITGILLGTSGEPVAGATVQTRSSGHVDNPLTAMLQPLVVERTTSTQATSEAGGRFVVPRLTPGSYQIKITHPDYVAAEVDAIEVAQGQSVALGTIQLMQGTTVAGRVLVDGRPAAQVRVAVQPVYKEGVKLELFEAMTDPDGRFQLERKLPAGDYVVTAAQSAVADPFEKLRQTTKSRTELRLTPGQARRDLELFLESSSR
jgi:hypothetical protein